jgi:hypothetical protein
VEPADPIVGSSTIQEQNGSDKVGSGAPVIGENKTNGPLDRVRVDSSQRTLTTNQGVPVADNQNSLKAGLRGPKEDFDDATMDACLIAGGQRAEHYEMAAYGTLVAWARTMGHIEAADLLEEILEEEKAADEKLTALAEGGINQGAADEAHPAQADNEDEGDADAKPAGRAKKPASKAKAGSRR